MDRRSTWWMTRSHPDPLHTGLSVVLPEDVLKFPAHTARGDEVVVGIPEEDPQASNGER